MAREASSHPMLRMPSNVRQSLQQPHRRSHKAGCRASCAGQQPMVSYIDQAKEMASSQPAEAKLLMCSALAGNPVLLLQLSHTTAGLQGLILSS